VSTSLLPARSFTMNPRNPSQWSSIASHCWISARVSARSGAAAMGGAGGRSRATRSRTASFSTASSRGRSVWSAALRLPVGLLSDRSKVRTSSTGGPRSKAKVSSSAELQSRITVQSRVATLAGFRSVL
jgi:hypothetical protein